MKYDSEKGDLHIWNNEVAMALNNNRLAKIKQAKTKEDLLELSKDITLGLWYGDFYSPNDGHPL